MSRRRRTSKKLLEVSITYNKKGDVDYITIFEGDDLLTLAETFVEDHRLKPSNIQVIHNHLKKELENHHNLSQSNDEISRDFDGRSNNRSSARRRSRSFSSQSRSVSSRSSSRSRSRGRSRSRSPSDYSYDNGRRGDDSSSFFSSPDYDRQRGREKNDKENQNHSRIREPSESPISKTSAPIVRNPSDRPTINNNAVNQLNKSLSRSEDPSPYADSSKSTLRCEDTPPTTSLHHQQSFPSAKSRVLSSTSKDNNETWRSSQESSKDQMKSPTLSVNNPNAESSLRARSTSSVNRRQLQDFGLTGLGSHNSSGIMTPEYYLSDSVDRTSNIGVNGNTQTTSTDGSNAISTMGGVDGIMNSPTPSVPPPMPPSQVVESMINDQNNKALNALEHSYQAGDVRTRDRSASQRKLSEAPPMMSPARPAKIDTITDRSNIPSSGTVSVDSGEPDGQFYDRLKSMNSMHVNDTGSRDQHSFGISGSIDYQERSLTPTNNLSGIGGGLGIAGAFEGDDLNRASMYPFGNNLSNLGSVMSVEEAEEDYYSRLKNDAMKLGRKNNHSHGRSLGDEFRPSSNFLQLSRSAAGGVSARPLQHGGSFLDNASVNSVATDQLKGNMIGKGAHERLYHSATLHRKKQAIREKHKQDEEKRRLEEEQFRLNENSRRITEHLVKSRHAEGESIGERLYSKGMKDLEFKNKKEDEKKKKIEEIAKEGENWSCSKCATFHQVHVNVSSYKSNQVKVCRSCGFNQSDVTPHKPCNIALRNYENAEELLQHRQTMIQQVTSNALGANAGVPSMYSNHDGRGQNSGTSTVHEYLYRAKREEDTLHTNRQLWQELNADMTFKPVIPESSKQILKKYKQLQHQHHQNRQPQAAGLELEDMEGDDDDDVVSQVSSVSGHGQKEMKKSAAATVTGKKSNAHNSTKKRDTLTGGPVPNGKLSGDALREYVSKPATERLMSTTTVSAAYHTIEKKGELAGKHGNTTNSNKKSATATTTNKKAVGSSSGSVAPPTEKEAFVNRLAYEYKEKDQKLKAEMEKRLKYDEKTGQKLFRPKVEPVPEGLFYHGITTSTRYDSDQGLGGNVWEDILRRDAELQEKKKQLQKKAIDKSLNELKENQVKALPSSNEILQKSTEKHLEELYRILLASTIEEAQTTLETLDEEYRDYCEKSDNDMDDTNNNNEEEDEADKVAKLHQRAKEITDWKTRPLDLMKVNPSFMINEVSTLLLDMKTTMFLQWQKKQATGRLNEKMQKQSSAGSETSEGEFDFGGRDRTNKESPENLNITYDNFVKLALKCIKQRDGPGRGYIFITKKKPEIALELKEKEMREETFHPAIDKTSIEILNKNCRQLRMLSLPIETILQADGDRVKHKVEQERQKKVLKEAEELTFKPKLFKPPSYVVPRYRGMDDTMGGGSASSQDPDDVGGLGVGDDEMLLGEDMVLPHHHGKTRDDNSLADFIKSASNHQTFAVPFGESEGSKVLFNLRKKNGESGGNGFFIRGGGSVVVNSASHGQQVIGSTHSQQDQQPRNHPAQMDSKDNSSGSTPLNLSGSAASPPPPAHHHVHFDPVTPPHNQIRSKQQDKIALTAAATPSFVSPVHDQSASSLYTERVTPPSSSSVLSASPISHQKSAITTPQSIVEKTIAAGMNGQRSRANTGISTVTSATDSYVDHAKDSQQQGQGHQLFSEEDDQHHPVHQHAQEESYGYGYSQGYGRQHATSGRRDQPMAVNELGMSEGYGDRAMKQRILTSNKPITGPPPLPASSTLAREGNRVNEGARSVSPDMSKFSDNTISTKCTIESAGIESKASDAKNANSYSSKLSQTLAQRSSNNSATGPTGRNLPSKSTGSIASNNSAAHQKSLSSTAKPIAVKAKHIPPPLPCERDKKKKEEFRVGSMDSHSMDYSLGTSQSGSTIVKKK